MEKICTCLRGIGEPGHRGAVLMGLQVIQTDFQSAIFFLVPPGNAALFQQTLADL